MSQYLLPTYRRADLSFTHGQGSWLIERSGERYLDFASGVGVCSLGHAHPDLVQTLHSQATKLWHVSNLYRIEEQEQFAQMLVKNSFADRVFVTNSGSEAVECAIKGARKFHSFNGNSQRWRIITCHQAFHGRTLATIAAAGRKGLIEGFGPMPEGFDQVEFNNIEAIKRAVSKETAAVLVEPLQGEGGIRSIDHALLRQLRSLCDEENLLLLLDEVQCGTGRTGKMFAHEWADITPDIMPIAKGIGSGFPLGACLFTEKAAAGMVAGSHGSTYGGNPLACAVGSAVLQQIGQEKFLAHVRDIGALLHEKLMQLLAGHSQWIKEIRGQGLMLGIKCRKPAAQLLEAMRRHKLLSAPADDNVVRLLPPLNISKTEAMEAISRIEAALIELESNENDE